MRPLLLLAALLVTACAPARAGFFGPVVGSTWTAVVASSNPALSDGSIAYLNGPSNTQGFVHEAFKQESSNMPSLGFWSAGGVRGSSSAVSAGYIGGIFVKGFDGVNPLMSDASQAQVAFVAEDAFRNGHTPVNINFVTQKGGSSGTTNRRAFAMLTSTGPFIIGNLGTAGVSGVLDSGATAQLQVTADTGILHAIYANGAVRIGTMTIGSAAALPEGKALCIQAGGAFGYCSTTPTNGACTCSPP